MTKDYSYITHFWHKFASEDEGNDADPSKLGNK